MKLLSRRALNYIKNIKEVDPFLRGVSVWIGFKQEYVGLYIARIYEQLQGRPRYIIKEIIEPPKGQKQI